MLFVILLLVWKLTATAPPNDADNNADLQGIYNFLVKYEGKNKRPYKDSSKKWHIGLGHLILQSDAYLLNTTLTEEGIFNLFKKDYEKFRREFEAQIKVFEQKMGRKIWKNEKIAYFSFGYNLGFDDLARLFNGNYVNFLRTNKTSARNLYASYSIVNGQRDNGIYQRRLEEFAFMYK